MELSKVMDAMMTDIAETKGGCQINFRVEMKIVQKVY
jgi:hypothetical protein